MITTTTATLYVTIYIYIYICSSPSIIRPSLLQVKIDLIIGMSSLEGDNLVVFYYLSASEILIRVTFAGGG